MNEGKTNIFKKAYNWFLNVDWYKNHQKDTDKAFYLSFLYKTLVIFLSLFLSFVFPSLNFLPVVMSCLIILTENSYNRLYYFAALTPFWYVFKYIYVVYGLICCLWALKILRDILTKNIKFSKKLILIVSIFVIYCLAVLKFSILKHLFLFGTVCLFLFLFLYRDKIDYTKLILTASISIICSAVLGIFGVLLKDCYPFPTIFYYGNGNYRFNGCITDPNFYSILCISVFSAITFLFLNKNITFILYSCLMPIFIILNITTGSKMGFFIMIFLFIFLFLVLLLGKDKNKWKQMIVLGLIIALCFLILSKNLKFMFSRFGIEPADITLSQFLGMDFALEHPFLNSLLTSSFGKRLSSITTYRFNLWIYYLGYLLDNPLNLIFGFGEHLPDVNIIINSQILKQPHNSIVDMILVYGTIYLLLVTAIFIIYIIYKKKRGYMFNKLSILPIITIFISVCAISLFWSGIFLFLATIFILPIFEKRGDESENIINK